VCAMSFMLNLVVSIQISGEHIIHLADAHALLPFPPYSLGCRGTVMPPRNNRSRPVAPTNGCSPLLEEDHSIRRLAGRSGPGGASASEVVVSSPDGRRGNGRTPGSTKSPVISLMRPFMSFCSLFVFPSDGFEITRVSSSHVRCCRVGVVP
jgi:hypothetical protein